MVRLIVKNLPNKAIKRYKSIETTNANKTEKEVLGNADSFAEKDEKKKNKKTKKSDDMINEEQILAAEKQASNLSDVKVVKKERGLIERTESSKIILTEDNRQVLND